MPSMSGNAKIERTINQLENCERLLMQLPKAYYKSQKQRELLERLSREIYIIRETIKRDISSNHEKK